MSHSTHRKISSNLTLGRAAGWLSMSDKNRAREMYFFSEIHFHHCGTDAHDGIPIVVEGESSSSSSSGNKVCFIFTIPPAKYRPVFPRDIDISGVPGLLLLTPFLHWHGIYVFFLLFPHLAFVVLLFLSSPALSSSPFYVSSASPSRHRSLLSSSFFFLVVIWRRSLLTTHAPPNSRSPSVSDSETINHACISPRS